VNYVVIFKDNEERAGKRAEFMQEHLAFLRANEEKSLLRRIVIDVGVIAGDRGHEDASETLCAATLGRTASDPLELVICRIKRPIQ
jgi:hypothetical protein